jgi:hypothetical protein
MYLVLLSLLDEYMVVCICVEAQNNVLQLPSKQIQHEGYGNPLHHHHHNNNNNNNRMLGFTVINQLWENIP